MSAVAMWRTVVMLITPRNAEVAAAWANWGLLGVAALALAVAFWQIRATQRSTREATAKAIWHDYEKLCFENPTFANVELLGTNAINTTQGNINGDRVCFERYQWFVAAMLGAADEIIATFGREDDWRRYVKHHLQYHKPYLKSSCFEPLQLEVSHGLRKMIDDLDESASARHQPETDPT